MEILSTTSGSAFQGRACALLPVHWYVDVVVGLQATKLDH